MTMLCIDYGWEEVGWRQSRQPTSSQKPNLLIACHSERSEESNKLKKLIQTIFYLSAVIFYRNIRPKLKICFYITIVRYKNNNFHAKLLSHQEKSRVFWCVFLLCCLFLQICNVNLRIRASRNSGCSI